MTTAVLVHGGWHGAWCWDLVRARLEDAGVPSVAFDLPMTTLDEDARVVSDVLRGIDDETVVMGHSWGGSPMTLGAGGQPRVRHLIYLSAFMLEAGVPVTDHATRRPTTGTAVATTVGDMSMTLPERALEIFYNDVPPELAAEAVTKLRPFALSGYSPVTTTTVAAWKTVSPTYVVCRRDLAIHPDDQREMAKTPPRWSRSTLATRRSCPGPISWPTW
jgi:pimeloyl-ACP methyl ester carboxylesterase